MFLNFFWSVFKNVCKKTKTKKEDNTKNPLYWMEKSLEPHYADVYIWYGTRFRHVRDLQQGEFLVSAHNLSYPNIISYPNATSSLSHWMGSDDSTRNINGFFCNWFFISKTTSQNKDLQTNWSQ